MNTDQTVFSRGIRRIWKSPKQRLSPIHSNSLLLEPGHWEEYDPFLFLAEDWFQKGSFDVHPHRGIETVTYVMEGRLEHFDSKGGKDTLEPGDVQWMTAGRGVVHLEDPAPRETVHSLQLWVNLPSGEKMCEPRYQNLRRKNMPVRKTDRVEMKIFSGSSGNVAADTLNYVPITMIEFTVEPGVSITQQLPGTYNGFIYVLEGTGEFGKDAVVGEQGQILWLDSAKERTESEIRIAAQKKLRVLLYAGQPLREPVVARGPFVMNTEEQIKQAYQDYWNGKFN